MFARRVKREEREAFAMPFWEQVNKIAFLQQLADTPPYYLSDTGSGDAFHQHRLRVGKSQRPPRFDRNGLLCVAEFPVERSSRVRIEKLQAAMSDEIRRMFGPTMARDIFRRCHGEDRRLDQLARDQRRETRLPESDGKVDPVRHEIAEMLCRHELDR
jgi:hypothetical protein